MTLERQFKILVMQGLMRLVWNTYSSTNGKTPWEREAEDWILLYKAESK